MIAATFPAASCTAAPRTPTAISVIHLDDVDGIPQLVLAPQIRCDGSQVLVPLEQTYFQIEGSPVSAALLDRRGAMTRIDLDAIVETDVGTRDPAAIRHKIDQANRRLAKDCWRPMVDAGGSALEATWISPDVVLTTGHKTIRVSRPDVVPPPIPDDDCVPTEHVSAVLVDRATGTAVIRIDHTMHDNCGSTEPSWVVVPLPAPQQ